MKVLFNDILFNTVPVLGQATDPVDPDAVTPTGPVVTEDPPAAGWMESLGLSWFLIGAIILLIIAAGAFFYSKSAGAGENAGTARTIAIACIAIGLVLVVINMITYLTAA